MQSKVEGSDGLSQNASFELNHQLKATNATWVAGAHLVYPYSPVLSRTVACQTSGIGEGVFTFF